MVHPAGVSANRFPMSALADSTVRIFGDTAVLMGKVEMQSQQKSEIIPMTTVFPKQGHYASDAKTLAEYPPADVELARIGDLLKCDLGAVLKK